jgi:TP901 family phage tail tape measure protein
MGLRDIWIKIKGKDESGPALASANRNVTRLGDNAKKLGGAFKGGFRLAFRFVKLLAVGITGVVATSAAMIKVGYNFRKSMALVNTMLPEGSRNLKKFSRDIINLSMDLGIAKDELALGLYQTLSAEIPEDNAISFLATAGKAAVAGATDVATTVKALTKTMEAFGSESGGVANVADALFKTVAQGQISFSELASGIGGIAGVAASAGVSLDGLMGGIAKVSKVEEPRRAITALRSAIWAVVAPSDALSKELKKLGTTGQDLMKTQGIAGAFETVSRLAEGSTDKLKELLGKEEAMPAFLALTGKNAAGAQKNIAGMVDKLGAMGDAFKKQDQVRGWPRLWQSILGQITKIGVVMDRKLNPLASKIGKAIKSWGESRQFRGIITTLDSALDRAIKIGDSLGAGGKEREKAQKQIKTYFETAMTAAATVAMNIFEASAPLIGAIIGTVAANVIKAPINARAAKGVAAQQVRAEMGREMGVSEHSVRTVIKSRGMMGEYNERVQEKTREIMAQNLKSGIAEARSILDGVNKPDYREQRRESEDARSFIGSKGINSIFSQISDPYNTGTTSILPTKEDQTGPTLERIAKATEGVREDLNK